MLEVGWSEIFVVAIVLILVVGPKELPGMLRNFGRAMTKLRAMANEFRGQFEEALKEADLDDVRKGLASAQKLNPVNTLRDAIDPLRQMGQEIKSDLQKATTMDTPIVAPSVAEKKDEVVAPASKPAEATPVIATPAAMSAPPAAVQDAGADKAEKKAQRPKKPKPAEAVAKTAAETKPKTVRSTKAADSKPAGEKPVRKTTKKPAGKGEA
jgi:sec-independent protein translocase protein TatB